MKQYLNDTIYSTSNPNIAAIKIIRISGRKAQKISEIFNFEQPAPREFQLKNLLINQR